jgi:hypothetical protein
MKPLHPSPTKLNKPDRNLRRQSMLTEQRIRQKEQNAKRQRIVLSVNAGHVRGGHSFH